MNITYNIGKSKLIILDGSVLDNQMDVMIVATNPTGLGGGGVDAAFNELGGSDFVKNRKALSILRSCEDSDGYNVNIRIEPGSAKIIKSAGSIKSDYTILAVGPDYRECTDDSNINGWKDDWDSNFIEHDNLLIYTYTSIFKIIYGKKNINKVGCCLISCGIYSGLRGTFAIISLTLNTIMSFLSASKTPIDFYLYAYTADEIKMVKSAAWAASINRADKIEDITSSINDISISTSE
jgi:O-acetyl-ADP-ribose deacetylase (regulator of RNase III)